MKKKDVPCPCGSGRTLAGCCGPLLAGTVAPDAEALMRSRYTAYVREDEAYLLASWHPSTRPDALSLGDEPRPKWIGLSVTKHERQDDTHATVAFVARYKVGGKAGKMTETSRFVREDGRWYYLDGEVD